MSPRQRRVGPPHPPGGDRGAEPAVREVGLGDDHESRGVAVEPVHDAGSALGPAGQSRAARDERVDQRVVPMAWRGVDDQAGRLVDHGEVLVLVDHDERDGGGLESAGRLVFGEPDGDALTARQDPGGASGPSIHRDRLGGDEAGSLGAGEAQLIGEELVEALGLVGDDGELDRRRLAHAAEADSGSARRESSRHIEITRAMAPQLTAMSATLNVGQRSAPMPTSRKSTTPRSLRMRSIRLPAAPPATRPQGELPERCRRAGWCATSGAGRTPRRSRR